MKLTPELKEIALQLMETMREEKNDEHQSDEDFVCEIFARFLAALPNSKPAAVVIDLPISDPCGDFQVWLSRVHSLIPLDEGAALYTADAILYAAQPLRERIAELEAEVRQLRATPPEQRQDLHCVVSDISSECRELRQQNAELTKQLDGLLVSLNRIVSDSDGTCLASVRHLARIADKAIAKVKDAP